MPLNCELTPHERAATMLDAHPGYRVLRALPPPDRYPIAEAQGPVRTAVVVDVETMGLDLEQCYR